MGIKRKQTHVRYTGTMYCTREAYIANKQELREILEKKIPEMTREKSIAREKGDLRENSEYDSAKKALIELNAQRRMIAERLERASVITEDQVKTSEAGFGCHLVLTDEKGERSQLTLAGEWDDMPEGGIISVASPLGLALSGRKKGETATLNGKSYTIESIEKATDLFGHYKEHHGGGKERTEEAKKAEEPKKQALPPEEAIDRLFLLAKSGKEKEELVAFLTESGASVPLVQTIALDALQAKGDTRTAIRALNALNEWYRIEKTNKRPVPVL